MFPECSVNAPWMVPKTQKLPLIPAAKSILRGFVSIWRHTHTVPPYCRFFAHLQLIIMMEVLCERTLSSTPGIRRLVLLTLVFLRYSCLQVVFCINLGTFSKCFLQLEWRLTGVRSTHTEWFQNVNVPWMFPECSLNVPLWRTSGRWRACRRCPCCTSPPGRQGPLSPAAGGTSAPAPGRRSPGGNPHHTGVNSHHTGVNSQHTCGQLTAHMGVNSLPTWELTHCPHGSQFTAHMGVNSLPTWESTHCPHGSQLTAHMGVNSHHTGVNSPPTLTDWTPRLAAHSPPTPM
jgi:hypothetical protein